MNLVTFDNVCLEFGDQPLLVNADFAIAPGERACLIGRNGVGKSSMMKLITGDIQPDRGEVVRAQDLVASRLEQTLPEDEQLTVSQIVSGGLAELQMWIDEYQRRSEETGGGTGVRSLARLESLIESKGGWHIDQRVETVLSELGLPADRKLAELSGGWRRRVSLARALVNNPDLLLLDEPTNHLDLASIRWLEDRVRGFNGSVLFVTHDRAFLQKLASRIVELDRGRITSWPGDYEQYLRKKDEALKAEATRNREFDKKLEQEEAWIRQGLKARRKRNEGRVRSLQAMREERARRVRPSHGPRIHVEDADPSGRKVIEARNIGYAFGDVPLFEQLSVKIMRGDRVGLIGNNGVGKTTLLRILLGDVPPQTGTVKLGTGLQIGYFDQLRRKLDPEKTVVDIVGDGRDYININGKQRHVIGYLKGFLFSPKRALSPVKSLSGGETNRIILARLFTRPSNLLVLDEPTNDLDVETLEVLEDRLVEYPGTLIVVSHDRRFLDNVVTSVLVFEPGGRIREYLGGYTDWERRNRALREHDPPDRGGDVVKRPPAGRRERAPAAKLSYKDKLELEKLPDTIDAMERELRDLQDQVTDPGFYNRPFDEYRGVLKSLEEQEKALSDAMDRWSALEQMRLELETRNNRQ